MKIQLLFLLNLLIGAVRSVYNDSATIAAIKRAAHEIINAPGGNGSKTQAVIDAVRATVAATPTPLDDMAVEVLAFLYLRKFRVQATPAADLGE